MGKTPYRQSANDEQRFGAFSGLCGIKYMSEARSKDAAVRILLVEDSSRDIELMQEALKAQLACHLTVAVTRTAFEAELKRELPDIIVLDSNLTTFDGLTALAIAIHKCPEVPIVFCSGNASQPIRAKALARGATSWVSKDDGFAHLVCEVKRLCAHYKL